MGRVGTVAAATEGAQEREATCRRNIQLKFPPETSSEPVVCNLVRLFDLDFNILSARITPRRDGEMTVQLRGGARACDEAVTYLKGRGISVASVDQRIWHDETRCMHCGMCTALCPIGALSVDQVTRRLIFVSETCTACGMCVRVCPVRAMQLDAATDQELDGF